MVRFADDFKQSFLRGLAVVLPTVVTIAIIVWIIGKINRYIGLYINIAAVYIISVVRAIGAPDGDFTQAVGRYFDQLHDFWLAWLWWVGFLLAIVAVYILGRFVASIFGRFVWRVTETAFFRIPIIKAVYPYVKQVTDFVFTEHQIDFSRVVAVEYPRKGSWSLGLVTGSGMRSVSERLGGDVLTVFVPSSPTPMTGYTLMVSRSEVIDLPISVEEAVKFSVSAGLIMPISEQMASTKNNQAKLGPTPHSPQQQG